METAVPPLEDPTYEPQYRPENGRPPAIVAKWGARSQLRWFRRFSDEVFPMRNEVAAQFHIHSEEHLGPCCAGCISDEEYTGYPVYDDHCCCKGYEAAKEASGTILC